MNRYKIKFKPDDKVIEVDEGISIKESADMAGITIDSPCGGKGTCGKCVVIVQAENLGQPSEAEENFFTEDELKNGYRLACQTYVNCDMEVTIPQDSRIRAIKILSAGKGREVRLHPNISKVYVELSEQTLDKQIADLTNVKEALKPNFTDVTIDLELLRKLPSILR